MVTTAQEDLWALVLRWRREALNLQHRQPQRGPLRIGGEERARCADELEVLLSTTNPRRWYCGMCERLFAKGGDCPRCGFKLERWPA